MSLDQSQDILSLSHLCANIKSTLNSNFSGYYWVVAELSEVRLNKNGHCYIELVEKEQTNQSITAKIRGIIFANIYPLINTHFVENTGISFAPGIKVLMQVSIDYNPIYGIGLRVHDIDPNYTIGNIAQQRQNIINTLKKEGVLDLNKELSIPTICKRIAIISSSTAAGYEDFCTHLMQNKYGFYFDLTLFQASMQGEQTESSILKALDSIYRQREQFDAVVIIRGGGATSDLYAFDTYLLAASCAQFPLPIIVGIGHERDSTVLDYVVNTSLKTPTAVANWLIDRMLNVYMNILRIEKGIYDNVKNIYAVQSQKLDTLQVLLITKTNHSIKHNKLQVTNMWDKIKGHTHAYLRTQKEQLRHTEKYLQVISPQNTLKRGYTLVFQGNKIIKSSQNIDADKSITIQFANETIQAKVESKN